MYQHEKHDQDASSPASGRHMASKQDASTGTKAGDVQPSGKETRPGKASGRGFGRLMRTHRAAVIIALVALSAVLAGTAYAWIVSTGSLANQFGIGAVTPSVEEKLDGLIKSDVKVTNTGATTSYVRAQVDIYWQDDAGNRLWDGPQKDKDYFITWGSQTDWAKGADGFWYYTKPVAGQASTENLINKVEQSTTQRAADAAAKRYLVVDISTQAIQADPANAVKQAWSSGVSSVADDGARTIKTTGGAS